MTPERTAKMYKYVEQFPPAKSDYPLVEKMGEVIVNIGEALDQAQADLQTLRDKLNNIQKVAKRMEQDAELKEVTA